MSMNMNDQAARVTERTEPLSGAEVAAQTPVLGSTAEAARFGPRPANGSRPSVELHIEELVLNGFAPAHRYTIGDAIERELTRLFTEQGAPIAATQDVEIAHLNGGAINMQPGANVEATGIQLARAIYGGLGK